MKEIFQTPNFLVVAVEKPHVSREEGGHIVIAPKLKVVDRTQLSPQLAIELQRLTLVVGEAMVIGMNKRGVAIGRINYQDNGNWGVFKPEGPALHVHLYGRAKNAQIQKYGEALNLPKPNTGFYDSFTSLNDGDIKEIKIEIENIFTRVKYQDINWRV